MVSIAKVYLVLAVWDDYGTFLKLDEMVLL